MSRDTIFAPATSSGKSGVAIVRLSGEGSKAALTALTGRSNWQPYLAQPITFRAPGHDIPIDHGLALYFQGPRSFTGEDVAELQLHGSPAVMRELLEVLSHMKGLRPAEPGEFSRRAFINGKMDLVEAEGMADLIDAETAAQKTQALRQMRGDLSRYYEDLRSRIIRCLAHLEAYIDFPDEEIPHEVFAGLQVECDGAIAVIEAALADQKRGERLRDGISVVILGAPNAGKSSLLNAIAGRDAAIVSTRAGTTRDIIEVHMDMAGFPVILTDTAGLRQSSDEIEEEGIRRARARGEAADIRLLLIDGQELSTMDNSLTSLIDNNTLVIINKIDISGKIIQPGLPGEIHTISVKTGEGMEALLKALETRIVRGFAADHAPVITRARHRAQLQDALAALQRFSSHAPLELACEELRQAAHSVGKITGKIDVDELLDVIFKEFCIGK